MSDMQFTPAQQDAIDARGGSILVSAAAGSGKTRVLVQRVIGLLTDKDSPVDADRLLIVTFTRAAAEEMRGRIASAIDDLLVQDPDNIPLRRQQLLLANADICTIHSFCSRIIRDNFFALDINQDFRIASEGEALILRQKVLSDIIEERYSSGDEGFGLLSSIISEPRSDKALENTILSSYISAWSRPFPNEWLDTVRGFYDPDTPLNKTVFARIAFDLAEQTLVSVRRLLDTAEDVINANPDFVSSAASCGKNKLDYLKSFVSGLERRCSAADWDGLSQYIKSFDKHPYRKPTGKKVTVSDEDCMTVKNCFESIDRAFEKTLLPVFGISSEAYSRDCKTVYPAVSCLCDILAEFDERYFAAKKDRGVLDFSDLEHLLLRLLVAYDEDGVKKTALARSLSEHYEYVMVDEYQDTNETQECIFRFLSRDEKNLFVVGDVKQSIYRFREAVPGIFRARRASSKKYDRNCPEFPAKIILDRNFRSSRGIIDSINYVFSAIMSEEVGEIEYNDDEKLTVGAEYPVSAEPETEIHLINASDMQSADDSESDEADAHQREAEYIASLIRKMVNSGYPVKDGDNMRPARYGDFAVLMRFITSNGQVYADALNSLGIPACIDKPYSLFECYEVRTALSFLRMVDNPLQDIPVLSVLLCPVFGFTPDQLAQLRTDFSGSFLFSRLVSCSRSEDCEDQELKQKCEDFMKLFSELRTLSVTVGTGRLLSLFFERTGFVSVISSMDNGALRVRNIHKLMSYIEDFESGGKTQVSDFIRHLDFLEENGKEISVADTAQVDAVRIMSIHHSKGLEFPVCIMADLSSLGNRSKGEVMYHPDLGFGMKTIDSGTMLKFNTLQRSIIDLCKTREEKSEAMRVLYVAMTRAKEKIIAVVTAGGRSQDGAVKKIEKLASSLEIQHGSISPYSVAESSSFADWLLMCALVHPDMKELRSYAGVDVQTISSCNSRWKFVLASEDREDITVSAAEEPEALPDSELSALLKERFALKYPDIGRTVIPSKVAASLLVHSEQQMYHIASSVPAFMQEGDMTAAEKGTAVHTFLQFADMKDLDLHYESEKERLLQEGHLSSRQAEAIKPEDIYMFTRSEVYKCICSGGEVYREYRFTVNIDASDVDPTYPAEEKVILQGAIDCMVIDSDGIVIIDYKTDRVKEVGELSRRYGKQLYLYKKAAEKLFDLPVKKCLIYSVRLGTCTTV